MGKTENNAQYLLVTKEDKCEECVCVWVYMHTHLQIK